MPDKQDDRTLSDADVEAIAEKVMEQFAERFYSNIGKGLWGVVSKALLGLMIVLAAWGAATGGKFHWPSGTP